MAKQTATQKMQAQITEMFRILAEYAPKLKALMPPNAEISGDPDGEMHFSMSDWNSCEAARVTLERFGHGVAAYSVSEPTQWFIRFADEAVGDAALQFYNRLPRDMRRYRV